jgi:hypothetical protein
MAELLKRVLEKLPYLLAYDHAKRLKTLPGLMPHEFVCVQWQKNPTGFIRDPTRLSLGPYT